MAPSTWFGLLIIMLAFLIVIQHVSSNRRLEKVRWISVDYYGPVQAHAPLKRDLVRGTLGIVDDNIVFHPRNGAALTISVAEIRWVGTYSISTRSGVAGPGGGSTKRAALVIHYEVADVAGNARWRVANFMPRTILRPPRMSAQTAARSIAALAGLELGLTKLDYGPVYVTRERQDWSGGDEGECYIYLAPDRLFFGEDESIPLQQLQSLEVYTARSWVGLASIADDSLQITYANAAGKYETVSFRWRQATNLARAISKTSGIELTVHKS